jgi:hypothetical protein
LQGSVAFRLDDTYAADAEQELSDWLSYDWIDAHKAEWLETEDEWSLWWDTFSDNEWLDWYNRLQPVER